MKMSKLLLLAFMLIGVVACKYDDDALWNKVNSLDDRVTSIEGGLTQMNSDINAISTIVNALQNKVYVESVNKTENGYQIAFTDGKTVVVKNGENGKDGEDGKNGEDGKDAPVISIGEFEGKYYWLQIIGDTKTWLTDKDGNKLPVTGADAVTPILKVNAEGYWLISYDRGITFELLLDEQGNPVKAIGKDGQDGVDGSSGLDGDSFFSSVKVEDGELVLVLKDGTELRLAVKEDIMTTVSGKIEDIAIEGCSIFSIAGEAKLFDSEFNIESNINECVQTFVVKDEGNNILLMSRVPLKKGEYVTINAQSTAIAMVTWHPLFSPVKNDDYQSLVDIITGSPKFQAFYEEVKKSISNRQNLFDEKNENLLLVFSELMEDLCGNTVEDGDYSNSLDDIVIRGTKHSINTRGVYEHSQINPTYIDAQINGNALSLRTVWVTPSYYGTVTQPNGDVVNKVIPSRSDFGIMDLAFNRTTRGEPMDYSFSSEGNYKFDFSRVNAAATLDFYMRIAGSILSTLGLSIGGDDEAIVASAKMISNAITAAGSGVSDGDISPLDWLGIAYDAALTQLSTGSFFGHNVSEAIVNFSKVAASSFNWYNKIKGAANLGLRLAYAFDAPETIKFCLCYYNHEVTTCTEASLYKVSGDGQTGYANQKLLLPLTVYVQTLGDDGMYYGSSSYHRVKFEVISGNGVVEFDFVSADNENKASTYWTLGTEGEQTVKATVVDIITGKEISEPVYFTASLENAQITIRLDWSKHSGNTDIDLHVVDPFGEEIAFYHMYSASGGYLDRDDIVGPGPEHVRWNNAPAGTYKIYVHYYPNGAEDRSITSYKVSVTADGVTYQPKTGSIAYDQYIPIGQFTIGNTSTSTRSISLEQTKNVIKRTFPKK